MCVSVGGIVESSESVEGDKKGNDCCVSTCMARVLQIYVCVYSDLHIFLYA